MDTIVIKANKKQSKIIRKFLDDKKVDYTIEEIAEVDENPENENESPYDPEFVEMILRSSQQAKEGKGRLIKLEDLWK